MGKNVECGKVSIKTIWYGGFGLCGDAVGVCTVGVCVRPGNRTPENATQPAQLE